MSPMCPGSIWCQRESSVLTLKNDLSQQDLEGGRRVWQSPAPCWQPNTAEEEGIIRITHTNTQIHTSTHKYSCTEYSHTLHQTCEIVCMPACTEKRKENISWLIFSTSNGAWRCGRCHVRVASTQWHGETRLNTAKTDSKNCFYDTPHLSYA